MKDGFIKIHRKIKDWEWYRDINTKVVFLDLLIEANISPARYMGMTVQRGSLVTTIPKLGSDLGMTIREIRTALSHLKATGEIEVKTTNKFSVIKVLNYEVYQGYDPTERQSSDSQATVKRHSNDILTTRIEEEEKEEEEKEEKNSSLQHGRNKEFENDSDEMKLACLLADRMRQNNPSCRLPSNFQEWCRHFDLMIRRDGRTPKEIQDVIIFSQSNPFWLSNILSARKLREKYDQLTLKMKEGCVKGERPRRFVN